MDESQLAQLYQQYLGRAPDPSGIATWSGQDVNSVIAGITGSQEYANNQANQGGGGGGGGGGGDGGGASSASAPSADLNALYQQYLGRAPDASGIATWSGQSPEAIIAGITSSQEYQNKIGGAGGGAGAGGGNSQDLVELLRSGNTNAVIDNIYRQVLGREADPSAYAWAENLNPGIPESALDLARKIAQSEEGKAYAQSNQGQYNYLAGLSQADNPYTDPIYSNMEYLGGSQFRDASGGIINLDESGQPISYTPGASWYDEQLAKNPSALRGTDYRNQVYLAAGPLDQTYNFNGKEIPIQASEYQIDPQTGQFVKGPTGENKPVEWRPQGYNMWDDWGFPAAVVALPALVAGGTYLAGAYGAGGAGAGLGAAEGAAGVGAGAGATAGAAAGAGITGNAAIDAALISAGKGALTGAAMGGINAGISGKDIGQGILNGGLTGAVGGGLGSAVGGGALGNIIGGAGAGATGAALTGRDVLRGGLIGGVSSGLSSGLSQYGPSWAQNPVIGNAITGAALSGVMGGNVAQGALSGATGGAFSSAISPYISSAYNTVFGNPSVNVSANQPVSAFYPEGSGFAGNGGYMPEPAALTTTSNPTLQDIAQQYAQLPPAQQAAFDSWKEASYTDPALRTIDPTSGATIVGPSVKDMEAAIAILTGSSNAMAANTTPAGEKTSIQITGAPITADSGADRLDPQIAKGMQDKGYRLATQDEIGKPVYVEAKGGAGGMWNPNTGAVFSDQANAWVIPETKQPFAANQTIPSPENAQTLAPSFLPQQKSDMLAGDLGDKGYVPGEAYEEAEFIDPKTGESAKTELPKSVAEQPEPKVATPAKDVDPSKLTKENTATIEKKNPDGSAVVKNAFNGVTSLAYLNGEGEIGDIVQVTAATTSSPTAGTSYTAQEGSIPSGQIGISEIDTTPVQDVATQIPATTEQITQEGTGTGSGGGSGGGGAGGGGGGGAGGSSTAKGGKSTGSGATIRPQVANAKSGNVLNLPGITNLTPGYTKGRTNYELAGQFHFATGGSVNTDQSILDKYLANLTAGIIEGDQDYTLPGYAAGGDVENHNPEFFSEGGLGSIKNRYVKGAGDGTSDSIPAMLANGEFVIPADVVSSLGNGSNDSGAHLLDEFLKTIRSHKRRADAKHLPPDSKGPLGYLLEAKKKAKK